VVEADETYFGNVPEAKRKTKTNRGSPFLKKGRAVNKRAIVSLVERGFKPLLRFAFGILVSLLLFHRAM
jgi:hypothetical protein